jgi:GST-like protein
MGDSYTIADLAVWPWVRSLKLFYQAGDLVGLSDMPNVNRWLEAAMARPASRAAIDIPSRAA